MPSVIHLTGVPWDGQSCILCRFEGICCQTALTCPDSTHKAGERREQQPQNGFCRELQLQEYSQVFFFY